jgi:hypothetical protein
MGAQGRKLGKLDPLGDRWVDLERFFVVEKLDLGVLVASSTKGCRFAAHLRSLSRKAVRVSAFHQFHEIGDRSDEMPA